VSLIVALGVGLAGGVGAILRFLLDGAVANRVGRAFPFGTLCVNVVGAFALGMLVGAAVAQDSYRLEGTGLVGAFTTFSTWAFESHRLGEEGQLRLGLLNFGVSLLLGLLSAWAGRALGVQL
jgi:CrcB protein